jgi:hypothetical protein
MQKAAPIEVDYDAFGPYDCSFYIYCNVLNVKFLLDLDIVKIKGEERFFSVIVEKMIHALLQYL